MTSIRLLCGLSLAAATLAAAEPPKVFISADLEGVAGVVTDQQLGPAGFEYARFREFMTEEVLAAIGALRAAGAGEIVVADAHGNGQNLLIERFPDDVSVVRSWPRPLGMMQGIDASFDAVLLLGYHAGTTNPDGVRAHTLSSANYADLRLAGRSVPEAGLSAAIAGHFGVPVILVSGDDAAVEEARQLIGDVEGAVVKWSVSFHSARTLTPAAARRVIAERSAAALGRLGELQPLRLETPVTLDLRFKSYRPSQVLALLDVVERTDAHSIRYLGDDMLAVARFLAFVGEYAAGLEP